MSSRTIRQSVAALGVITSLAFVGMQIRESNIQARAAACLWPELRTQVTSSVRKFIEDSTPASERLACQVDLQALRDETILGQKKKE
jgi:hypothetical protein